MAGERERGSEVRGAAWSPLDGDRPEPSKSWLLRTSVEPRDIAHQCSDWFPIGPRSCGAVRRGEGGVQTSCLSLRGISTALSVQDGVSLAQRKAGFPGHAAPALPPPPHRAVPSASLCLPRSSPRPSALLPPGEGCRCLRFSPGSRLVSAPLTPVGRTVVGLGDRVSLRRLLLPAHRGCLACGAGGSGRSPRRPAPRRPRRAAAARAPPRRAAERVRCSVTGARGAEPGATAPSAGASPSRLHAGLRSELGPGPRDLRRGPAGGQTRPARGGPGPPRPRPMRLPKGRARRAEQTGDGRGSRGRSPARRGRRVGAGRDSFSRRGGGGARRGRGARGASSSSSAAAAEAEAG